jgi:hypothetical protein
MHMYEVIIVANKIDLTTLREIDALSDLFSQVESDPQLIE